MGQIRIVGVRNSESGAPVTDSPMTPMPTCFTPGENHQNLHGGDYSFFYADPHKPSLQKFCETIRKRAKENVALFHLNGFGIPDHTPERGHLILEEDNKSHELIYISKLLGFLKRSSMYSFDMSEAGRLSRPILREIHRSGEPVVPQDCHGFRS